MKSATGAMRKPNAQDLMWPVLTALRALGGSGTVQEIDAKASQLGNFSNEQLTMLHGKGPRTEIQYRAAWARWRLGRYGALANSSRGVWSLTELGRKLRQEEMSKVTEAVHEEVRKEKATAKPAANSPSAAASPEDEVSPAADDWKDSLLQALIALSPGAFEQLAARLLREKGFSSVEVLGRSGDSGIDGVGILRVSLLNFKIYFQCKRYKGSVGPGAVRDFRGAMTGRADKGLLITTGVFSQDAQGEASRNGAPPIDLIDGEQLCEILKDLSLGVTRREAFAIDSAFFASFPTA